MTGNDKNMRHRIFFSFVMLFLFSGCVENFEFKVDSESPSLVVEGFISDKSFNDTRLYPSDGRRFTIKLRETGRVTNAHDKVVSNAKVSLIDSSGTETVFAESLEEQGVYMLMDNDFSATSGTQYRLRIILNEGDIYESDWEQLPSLNVPNMGEICFEEVEKKVYRWRIDEYVLDSEKGIDIGINLPLNLSNEPIYYRWEFDPTWIYIAPLASVKDVDYKCWIRSQLYLSSFALLIDEKGGHKNNLIYMSLYRNERVFEKLSVLVTQQIISEKQFNFWTEMKEQSQRGGLFDAPPYNLKSNIYHTSDSTKKASGYFGVIQENAKRWYFDKNDLSYYSYDYLREDCLVVYGPGPPAIDCTSCLGYKRGEASTSEPVWWEK